MRALIMAALLAGCSSSSAPEPAASDSGAREDAVGDSCTVLDIGMIHAGTFGAAGSSVVALTSANYGDPSGDLFSIELLPGTSKLSVGSFDLAQENDYATCKHCVALYVDGHDAGTAKTMFFQESGTLTLTAVSDPLTTQFAGSVKDVKLVEVVVDEKTFATKKVEGGRCFVLPSASWNTVMAKPDACSTAADCGAIETDVCDPASGKCVPGQCGGDAGKACPAGQVCVYQAHGTTVGACYATCTPFASGACEGDAECVVAKFDGTAGYCKSRGTGAPDAACVRSDRTTSCTAGHVCDSLDLACRQQCDFFGDASCPAGQGCVPPGICTTQRRDAAKLGDACAATAKNGDPCGLEGSTLKGVCTGSPLRCAKWCRSKGDDCSSVQSCQATGIPSLGTCG